MIIRQSSPRDGVRLTTLLDARSEEHIRKYLPDCGSLDALAEAFSAFSDPSRLRIVSALSVSEMCVNDLSNVLGINQTTLSHQLRFLKSAGVVDNKKQGKVVFYSLSSPLVPELLLVATKLVREG